MYPWHGRLTTWADSLNLKIDALGLVTILGAEEMDRNIGRLVSNPYFDYLPLFGGFVVCGDHFTQKKPGFTLYNISAGIMTTELAGWFSRWLQTQDFYQVRSIVTWDVTQRRPPRWTAFFVGFLLVGLPCNGMLFALTMLAADWWGFANVIAMVVSVVVKCVLVAQNQAGIDANIREAKKKAPGGHEEIAKAIVVTEDSKAVTIAAPAYLMRLLVAASPKIPNPRLYMAVRWIGWIAFAVHVISIGMAALYTQIATVVVIVSATVLTGNKVGCDDSRAWKSIRSRLRQLEEDDGYTCWVSSTLKATVSSYPAKYTEWDEAKQKPKIPILQAVDEKTLDTKRWWNRRAVVDLESNTARKKTKKEIQERRQDLYAWLDLTAEEDSYMTAWGMMPRNQQWMNTYLKKKTMHRRRVDGNTVEPEEKRENEQKGTEISIS